MGKRCEGCGIPDPMPKCEYCGRRSPQSGSANVIRDKSGRILAFEIDRQAQMQILERGAWLNQLAHRQQGFARPLGGYGLLGSPFGLGLGRIW